MSELEIIGFDEVGRGSLAGPLVIACVVGNNFKLKQKPQNIIIRDSKKMTRSQREKANLWIRQSFLFGIGSVKARLIDKIGLSATILEAASLAIQDLVKLNPMINLSEYLIFNDGNIPWFNKAKAVIGGDSKIPEIAMASIVAKVYRDQLMQDLDPIYPNWGFAAHVGYGTKQHISMIKQDGLIKNIHRVTFCDHLDSKSKIVFSTSR